MTMRLLIYWFCMVILFCSCASSKNWNPDKKYAPEKLKKDFRVFRNVLEEVHPSLYWFTPKDSIDYYFDLTESRLIDSMTEREFRNHLNYMTNKFRCGHTSTFFSPKYTKYLQKAKIKSFPLSLKVWKDTAVATASLLKENKGITRGSQIVSINNIPVPQMIDSFLQHTNIDGYAQQGQYQYLSNRGNFGIMFKNLYGLTDTMDFGFIDLQGNYATARLPVFLPVEDTLDKKDSIRPERPERRERLLDPEKSLQIDTTLRSAYMTLNSFSRNEGMTRFFRKSFRMINKLDLEHLVIDLRSNGGGDAGLSTLLTRYVIDKPFHVADSLYAKKLSSRNRKYIQHQWAYWLFTRIVTRKRADGNYHFGFYERHKFKPKKKYHFKKNIFILTGGNSFSASTLFAQKLKGQSNVTIVGEETGGGAYGNTAWMIPTVKLPETGVRFRLPKFRLVMDSSLVDEGRGVMPDVYAAPSVIDIRYGRDVKLGAVRALIESRRK
jgi:hypothetical protein